MAVWARNQHERCAISLRLTPCLSCLPARVLVGSALTLTVLLPGSLSAQRVPGRPVATVDGVTIRENDVDKLVGSALWPLEDRIYRIQQQAVEALIKQRLLEREATRRKISLQTLVDTEVTAKVVPV